MIRKYLKTGMILLFAVFSFFGFNNLAQASTNLEYPNLDAIKNTKILVKDHLPVEATFDLDKNEKQEVTYMNDSGEEVTFGIEPVIEEGDNISVLCINNCTTPISTGNSTFKIYTYTGAVNISYHIKVNRTSSGSRITSAYDLSVTLIGYAESNRKFGFSSKSANYSATITLAKYLPYSQTIWLKAEISGNTLTTRAKA